MSAQTGGTGSNCIAAPVMIFFGSDSGWITDQSRDTLDFLAGAFLKDCTGYRIVIEGHTDRKGTSQENDRLSERMALNVRDHLAGREIPVGRMSVHYFGETKPSMQTADGVSEPYNRRVEVRFVQATGG